MAIKYPKMRFVKSEEDEDVIEIPIDDVPDFDGAIRIDGEEVGWVSYFNDAPKKGMSLDAVKYKWKIVQHPGNPNQALLIATRKKQ